MQVTVETTQGLERRMTITVDNTQVEGEIEKRIRQLAKTQRIDGFRPGKVPASVIRRRFGTAVRQEVAGELMQRNFIEAIIAEKINPAGAPRFEELPVEGESQDFAFAATFEVYPELELKGVEAIVVEKPVASVTDADLDNMIDTLRKQQASWEVAERAAEANDRVTIDFDGSVDGEAFEGGKAENFALEMGAGRMIPGFEDGIVGKNAGEAFDIDVTFPEDYHAENLKGKAAKFAIKLHKVEGRVLPEVDEAFAKRFGVEDGSVEGLRSEIRKNMERELEQAVKNNIKNQVIDGLLKANDIDLPRALVDQEIDTLRQQAMSRFGDMGGQNQPELPAELFEDQARKRVQVGLVLGEVIKAHELKVEDDRVQALIANMASAYEDPQEVIDHYNSNQELLQQIRNLALEDQAIDSVLDKAQVSEKATAFDDLMNPAANA